MFASGFRTYISPRSLVKTISARLRTFQAAPTPPKSVRTPLSVVATKRANLMRLSVPNARMERLTATQSVNHRASSFGFALSFQRPRRRRLTTSQAPVQSGEAASSRAVTACARHVLATEVSRKSRATPIRTLGFAARKTQIRARCPDTVRTGFAACTETIHSNEASPA